MVWQPEIDELRRRHVLAEGMGGPEGVARQHARGKLTIRERLALLVDEGSLQEMGKLQGGATYDDDGALLDFKPIGSVRGTARIDGRRVYVSGQDFTVRGGSAGGSARSDDGGVDIGHGHPGPTQLLLPTVNLLDGAGGSVQEYADLNRTYIPDGDFWEHLSNIVSLAPVASAVLGPAAGGLAPFPPMSHFSVIAKGTGQVFPGGPPVVKAARLVQICDTFHLPMVVIMDEPGFLVGVESERRGIERAGARLVHAICQSRMPWISFLSRRTFGLAGTLQYRPGPHLFRRYAWVSGRWGSMHIEGGTDAAFRRVIAEAPDPDAKRAEIEDGFRRVSSPFRTAEASGLDLIDPRDTRAILCDFVDMAQGVIKTQLGPTAGPSFRP